MLLKLERDENTCRKEMTASEMLDLARRLEALEKPRAEERRRAGNSRGAEVLHGRAQVCARPDDPAPSAHSSHYKVSEVIGPAVGLTVYSAEPYGPPLQGPLPQNARRPSHRSRLFAHAE